MALKVARLVNLFLTGLLTGNEFGSWVTVHRALGDLPPKEHVQAEQAMTRRYGRVMPVFMTTAIASFLPVLVLNRDRASASFRFSLGGLLCYAAMLAVTLTRNVPINQRLLELPADETSAAEFQDLRAEWDRLHTARNLLNFGGLTLTILATLWRSR